MNRNRAMLIFMAMLGLLLAACTSDAAPVTGDADMTSGLVKNADGYYDISPEQLAELLESTEVTLVNVHTPPESDIPQTDLAIPYYELADRLDELPDRESSIVLYCKSEGMSTSAALELVSLGYSKVIEVDGGFVAWEAAGYELVGTSQ